MNRASLRRTAATFLAAAFLAPRAHSDSTNWTVTVSAQESYSKSEIKSQTLSGSLSGAGGVQGWAPPAGTVNFSVTVQLRKSVCATHSHVFYNIPKNAPYYSVWYTFLGNGMHNVSLYAGNVGGQVIASENCEAACPNGYSTLVADFDSHVVTNSQETRTATAAGSLFGSAGQTASAAWYAAPGALYGGTLGSYQHVMVGDNPFAAHGLQVNPDNVSGTVTATFSSCIPTTEVCDGFDNNCNGAVDEGFGTASCGVGVCFTTVNTCDNGAPRTCEPLPASEGEACDGLDNDCDGSVDEGLGTLSCGVGACANTAPACSEGTAGTCTPLAPNPEKCGDGVDNDCDGVVDNGCTAGASNVGAKASAPNAPGNSGAGLSNAAANTSKPKK